MSVAPDKLKDATQRATRAVSRRHGTKEHGDYFTVFARSGENWERYPFDWEAFREMAGSVVPTADAVPVVVVSTDDALAAPLASEHMDPVRHWEIRISPAIPLPAIVETWIATIAPLVEPPGSDMGWFLDKLKLSPADISPAAQTFLGIGGAPSSEKKKSDGDRKDRTMHPELSATLRQIDSVLAKQSVTSFAIAERIQERHTEYAAGAFGSVGLESPDGLEVHPWETWRDSVAEQYRAEQVAASRHEVLDGRLFLIGLALLDPSLRERLAEERAWAQLLLEVDDNAAGKGSALRNALDSIRLAHGYLTDSVHGEDHLGIEGEVNAVCEVITDPDVAPPLAVGLFGAWGSGKSFFMEKMRTRIEELTAGSTPRRPATVRQIRFNAWHYADTSLWASLAVEIFDRLADPEPVDPSMRAEWLRSHGDANRAKREKLIVELETYREARAALAAERKRLDDERNNLEKARNDAAEKRRERVRQHDLTNIVVELSRDPEVQDRIGLISENLGIAPAVDELETLGTELRTLSGHLGHAWRLVKGKEWAVILGASSLLLGVLALRYLTVESATMDGMLAAVGSVASLCTTVITQILPAARKANSALAEVEKAIAETAKKRAALESRRSREERELEVELQHQEQVVLEKNRAISELDRRIAAVTAEAEALSVGRSLYAFLADRAAGYKKHQGVVGMLHRDFRLLDAQLRAHAAEASKELPPIDRVVLYVDDLDRCPPAKVLEVLEAVHLLLALPLFIVVVGVDPRWLDRSLRHQYRELASTTDGRADPYLMAMPTEYLEKIFQIALTLPAMEPASYARLIASMAPGVNPTAAPRRPSGGQRRRSRGMPGGERVPTRSLLTVQPGSAAAGGGTEALGLTQTEIEFAQSLGPLISSPRAAKRLMNTYRLIRATRSAGSSAFIGTKQRPGDFHAVLTLLAVGAGFPILADRLLAVLEWHARDGASESTWATFVSGLQPPVQTGDPWGKYFPEDLRVVAPSDVLANHERAQWINLAAALLACTATNPLQAMEPYHRWGPVVARFSFTVE